MLCALTGYQSPPFLLFLAMVCVRTLHTLYSTLTGLVVFCNYTQEGPFTGSLLLPRNHTNISHMGLSLVPFIHLALFFLSPIYFPENGREKSGSHFILLRKRRRLASSFNFLLYTYLLFPPSFPSCYCDDLLLRFSVLICQSTPMCPLPLDVPNMYVSIMHLKLI